MQPAALRRHGARGRNNQIGLPHEESRKLNNFGNFGYGFGLRGLVQIGDDGHAVLGLHRFQHGQPLFHAGPAIAGDGGTIGFIPTGFENIRQVKLGTEGFQLSAYFLRQPLIFQHIQSGHDDQLLAIADFNAVIFQFQIIHFDLYTNRLCVSLYQTRLRQCRFDK